MSLLFSTNFGRQPLAAANREVFVAVRSLVVAERGARLVGAAAAPHFRRVDGQERRAIVRLPAGKLCRQFGQRLALRFGAANQIERGVRRDGPGPPPFKNGGNHRPFRFNLTELHKKNSEFRSWETESVRDS